MVLIEILKILKWRIIVLRKHYRILIFYKILVNKPFNRFIVFFEKFIQLMCKLMNDNRQC